MSLRNIAVVYRKELTEALRDRRTLISSLLVPLVLFPVLTAGFGAVAGYMVGSARRESPEVMLLGGEDSPDVLAELKNFAQIRVVPTTSDWKQQIEGHRRVRAIG